MVEVKARAGPVGCICTRSTWAVGLFRMRQHCSRWAAFVSIISCLRMLVGLVFSPTLFFCFSCVVSIIQLPSSLFFSLPIPT
ncbi:hypothetical protein BDW60DRAFT_182983 [Aspergillus nidulans var. acristatus]